MHCRARVLYWHLSLAASVSSSRSCGSCENDVQHAELDSLDSSFYYKNVNKKGWVVVTIMHCKECGVKYCTCVYQLVMKVPEVSIIEQKVC